MKFHEVAFHQRLDDTASTVRRILHATRNPVAPADTPHSYTNKYELVEFVSVSALAAVLNVLETLGLTQEKMKQIVKWAAFRSVMLRFISTETCTFVKEVKTRHESPEIETQTSKAGWPLSSKTEVSKVSITVTEYVYALENSWTLLLYEGSDPENKIVLQSRSGTSEIKTQLKDVSPFPKISVGAPIDVNITFLLKLITSNQQISFSVDRTDKDCHTPRRNKDVDESITFFSEFSNWSNKIEQFLVPSLSGKLQNHNLDLLSLDSSNVFVPIVPMFEEAGLERIENAKLAVGESALVQLKSQETPAQDEVRVLLSINDADQFLAEQKRSLDEKLSGVTKSFPTTGLMSVAEAKLVVIFKHAKDISYRFILSVDYVEHLLRTQLISAIGKEIQLDDFSLYMRSHYRKLFKQNFQPRPFSHAVRQPDHFPEGTVSIEQTLKSSDDPILTLSKSLEPAHVTFSINSATTISVNASRHIHAAVFHSFGRESVSSVKLVARARQFSSFMLLIGTVVSSTAFDPKHAFIVQNKDEYVVPLVLEMIASGKQFRDAIESLSPEMQRFAKAYREVQLESTLFGILIIQIKPQLEKLLNLPHDSLTKEIQLTQDIMDMFLQYQIPSDLMTFDGPPEDLVADKITRVGQYVGNLKQMVQKAKVDAVNNSVLVAQHQDPLRKSSTVYESVDRGDNLEEAIFRFGSLPNESKKFSKTAMNTRSSHSRMDFISQPSQFMSFRSAPPHPAPTRGSNFVSLSSAQPHKQPDEFFTSPVQPGKQPQEILQKESAATQLLRTADIVTSFPSKLEAVYEKQQLDEMHPTTITLGDTWTKSYHESILSKQKTDSLFKNEQTANRAKAFDLLDALSRSGSLVVENAEMHVLVGVTHAFEQSLIDTVVIQNVDPISAFERGVLAVSETLFDCTADNFVRDDQITRIKAAHGLLLE